MSTIRIFHNIKSKHTLYRGEDCMKQFCSSLRKYVTNVINFEKKEMLPLTKEKLKLHQDAKICYICGKKILRKLSKSINYWKVRGIAILQIAIEAQHIVFVI